MVPFGSNSVLWLGLQDWFSWLLRGQVVLHIINRNHLGMLSSKEHCGQDKLERFMDSLHISLEFARTRNCSTLRDRDWAKKFILPGSLQKAVSGATPSYPPHCSCVLHGGESSSKLNEWPWLLKFVCFCTKTELPKTCGRASVSPARWPYHSGKCLHSLFYCFTHSIQLIAPLVFLGSTFYR